MRRDHGSAHQIPIAEQDGEGPRAGAGGRNFEKTISRQPECWQYRLEEAQEGIDRWDSR